MRTQIMGHPQFAIGIGGMQRQRDGGTEPVGPGLDEPQLEQALGFQFAEGGVDGGFSCCLAQLEEPHHGNQGGRRPVLGQPLVKKPSMS